MAKKPSHYVYSTLSSAVHYPAYVKGGADLPVEDGGVTIQGGMNIPDKYMRTPDGAVVTPVTDEELEILRASNVFKLHEKNGFMVIKDKNVDGEKVASDMNTRDQSAPLVEGDFKPGEEPVVGKADEKDANTPPKPAGGRRA